MNNEISDELFELFKEKYENFLEDAQEEILDAAEDNDLFGLEDLDTILEFVSCDEESENIYLILYQILEEQGIPNRNEETQKLTYILRKDKEKMAEVAKLFDYYIIKNLQGARD